MSQQGTQLPSGLVTFLFTDIEGSTRLLHRLGDRYVDLLERHRSIIRVACSDHDGVIVSESGDSEFVAFRTPGDAIAAAERAQRDLAAARWPDGVTLQVRMGLHTGMAWPHAGNYVALAVHRASRVMAAGHGGQTLASDATIEALGGDTGGWRIEPLGRYRLRDFDEPVGLHQISGDGREQAFPAVRALPADRHNIVRSPTETIGRDEFVEELLSMLAPGALITLTGPGGVGKSRIATDVGTRAAAEWSDGVWLADLAPVSDEELVVPVIAEAVGAPRGGEGDRQGDLIEHLQGRRAVIVLDNCEHLLGACRRVVGLLLERYPTIAIVTTSREPLRVAGESIRPVAPLAVPVFGASYDSILESPAVRLFSDRAVSAHPAFEVDAANAEAVAGICRELDGLPLFIELAAANINVQSPADILAGLEDSLVRLKARDPGVPQRHRTVDAVMDWSYRLLDEHQRTVFEKLSVFGSSFTLDTAGAAGADHDDKDVPETVWSLVDRSLVIADLTANATRYRLLEVVRTYARARLEESGDVEEVALNVARHFLDRFGPWLPAGVTWVGGVADEIDNVRSLIPLIAAKEQHVAQQLAYLIGRFHDSTHAFGEGIEELTRYVDALREPTPTRSSMLNMLAYLHLRTGEVEAAGILVDQAATLRSTNGAPAWDDVGVDRTMGEIARRRGELERAIDIAHSTLRRDLSDRGRSRMLNLLGTTSGALGDLETAYEALSQELELNRALGYDEYVAVSEGNLAETALRMGDFRRAARHQLACLELASAQTIEPMLAFSMLVAAQLAGRGEDWKKAVTLQTCAERLLDEIGLVLYEDDRAQLDALVVSATAALGGDGVESSRTAGMAMTVPDGVRLASDVLGAASHESDM